MVIEQRSSKIATLISMHTTQGEAEAERDKRNERLPKPRYSACIVLEPVAQTNESTTLTRPSRASLLYAQIMHAKMLALIRTFPVF
jgi:hypothetical protein